MRKKLFIALVYPLFLISCNTPETLRDFDSESWIQDKKGCNGNRTTLVHTLDPIRREFIGKKEYLVRRILGKPDHEVLMERSQRIYIYYIEPGTQCTNKGEMSEANRVEVKLNSLAKVSEVTYKEPIKQIKNQ
jgi:hypothetical protein